MRILGGQYKGLNIDTSKITSYRPTQARVRKSIFDILNPFTFSKVLDLYSGSGILGFESASRGAESITFVEIDYKAISLLKKNKNKFIDKTFHIIKKKSISYLNSINENYNLIFADPPYGDEDYFELINICIEKLTKNGKLIVEMGNNDFSYTGAITKYYGDTKLIIYTKK
tara:strand:+ start:81 stop:593 length:513 start_codon:yes stop_codon:yes gene_type:complete